MNAVRPNLPLLPVVLTVALVAAACSGSDPTLVATDRPTPAAGGAPSTPGPAGDPPGLTAADPTATAAPAATPTRTPDATPTPTPAGAEPDPAPSPTPGPSPDPEPDPSPEPGCVAGLAGDPVATSTATADIDGDGAPDQVTVYGLGGDTWRIRVDTSAGESIDSPMEITPGFGNAVTALGGADIDGVAATDELFAVTGAGASVLIVAMYVRSGCALVQVGLGGAPIAFPVGGGIGSIGGLECVDADGDGATDALVAWSGLADFDDGEGRYLIDGVEYRVEGTDLVQTGTRSFGASVTEADFVYGQLGCGTLSL